MAFHNLPSLLLLSLLATLFAIVFVSASDFDVPLNCSNSIFNRIKTCYSTLYHINYGDLQKEELAFFYSVNASSDIRPIDRTDKQDYLISVPCSCKNINGTNGYFYDVNYRVRQGDTFANVSGQIYSGQAWETGGEERSFIAGNVVLLHLLCGCIENDSQTVVTYTVQNGDTLLEIATLLSSNASEIESLNRNLIQAPGFIAVGWVLFVPAETNGI